MNKEQNVQQSDVFGQPQPEWVSVDDALPEQNGDYYTISEAQKDFPAAPKGAICINISDDWTDGVWEQDDDSWRVLYWAKPIQLSVPAALAGRQRIGCI